MHPSLLTLHNVNVCRKDKVKISKRTINSEAISAIKHELETTDWTYLESLDANESFSEFHGKLMNIFEEICPLKEYHIRSDRLVRDPWITKGLTTSLKKQKLLYKHYLKNKDDVSTNRYKNYRNLLRKLIRRSKIAYFNEKCLNLKQNSKKLWQLINQVINKSPRKSQVLESLKVNNLLRYSPYEITTGFCDHFANVGRSYAEKVPPPKVLVETYISAIK